MASKQDSAEEVRGLALDMYFEQLDQWILTEEELEKMGKKLEKMRMHALFFLINFSKKRGMQDFFPGNTCCRVCNIILLISLCMIWKPKWQIDSEIITSQCK